MSEQAMDGDRAEAPKAEMSRYRCHKEVWALKIAGIEQAPAFDERMHAGGDWLLIPEDKDYGPVRVGHDEYVVKHRPQVGGYYVVYDDGYKSYSPAAPFEAGYTLIEAIPNPPASITRADMTGEQLRGAYNVATEG